MTLSGLLAALALGFAFQPQNVTRPTVETLAVNGTEISEARWFATALPGERVTIDGNPVSVVLEGTSVASTFEAPDEVGTYELEIVGANGQVRSLAFFVLEPATNIDARRYLNGYRIGDYPKGTTPRGFIRVNAADEKVRISPRFEIGQFLCKQQPGHYPKYVLVTPQNLQRLETLMTSLRADGLTEADAMYVMSGFRTPAYNSAIGSATLSRHMYGDAADVWVDFDGDGIMDDLNGDGRLTKADANFLYDYAADLFGKGQVERGGLGSYGSNSAHGPFVHIDGRGRPARWGR